MTITRQRKSDPAGEAEQRAADNELLESVNPKELETYMSDSLLEDGTLDWLALFSPLTG